MKLSLLLCAVICLTGCFSDRATMDRAGYVWATLGMSACELKKCAGEPYAIHCCGENDMEYEYIERFNFGNEFCYQNHYYFRIVNGFVVSKRITREKQPAYDLIYQDDPNYPSYP